MNTISPLNPDVRPDGAPKHPDQNTPEQFAGDTTTDSPNYDNNPMPAFEIEQQTQTDRREIADAPQSQVTPPTLAAATTSPVAVTSPTLSTVTTQGSGFAMKYIASLLGGLTAVSALSALSFTLLDYFINRPEGVRIGGMFDTSTIVSTWHVWLVACALTFTGVYLLLSRATAKSIAANLPSERELNVAEMARSIFTALLLIGGVYLVASLVFTLLNGTLAAAEIDARDIAVQIAGSVLVIGWIVGVMKHQSAVHLEGKNGVAGIVIAVGAVVLSVLAAVFLLAAGRNAVIDSRTLSDLSTIESKLMSYNLKNESYPEHLDILTIDDSKLKSRLGNYKYSQIKSRDTYQSSYLDFTKMDSDSLYDTVMNSDSTLPPVKVGYKLCATFLTDASTKSDLYDSAALSLGASKSTTFYSHPKGEHCVEHDA